MLKKILETRQIFVVFLICLILTLGAAGIYEFVDRKGKNSLNGATDYNQLIMNGTEKEGTYVSVTFSELPYLVATYEEHRIEDKYYILVDQNELMYIAMMSDKTYNEIVKEHKKNSDNFSYTLTGHIYDTPGELKDIIIDMYNEDGESSINNTTFTNYFGKTYLNAEKQKYSTEMSVILIVIIVLLLATVIVFVMLVISIVRTRMTLSKVSADVLESELLVADMTKYEKAKIYLTGHYLLSTYLGLQVVDLENIAWVYISHSNNNIKQARLTLHLKDGKKVETMKCKMSMEDILRTVIQELMQKNQKLLVGYSYENLEAYNKMKNTIRGV